MEQETKLTCGTCSFKKEATRVSQLGIRHICTCRFSTRFSCYISNETEACKEHNTFTNVSYGDETASLRFDYHGSSATDLPKVSHSEDYEEYQEFLRWKARKSRWAEPIDNAQFDYQGCLHQICPRCREAGIDSGCLGVS